MEKKNLSLCARKCVENFFVIIFCRAIRQKYAVRDSTWRLFVFVIFFFYQINDLKVTQRRSRNWLGTFIISNGDHLDSYLPCCVDKKWQNSEDKQHRIISRVVRRKKKSRLGFFFVNENKNWCGFIGSIKVRAIMLIS